jgi:hypothetical protein
VETMVINRKTLCYEGLKPPSILRKECDTDIFTTTRVKRGILRHI